MRGVLLVLAIVAVFPVAAAASRAEADLRDRVYHGPTWGFSVRWYGDEWSVAAESSGAGVDVLHLADELGNRVGFEGGPRDEADAEACLDTLVTAFVADSRATDVVVVEDEYGAPQSFRDPRRSYTLLLAALPAGEGRVDYVASFDCGVLAPGRALLVRTYLGPAATFAASYDHLDVLEVALPRRAWFPDEFGGFWRPVAGMPDSPGQTLPLGASMGPYPREPSIVKDATGVERGAMTLVDGAPRARVVTIENTGDALWTIDPARFIVRNGFDPARSAAGAVLAPVRTAWEDGGGTGSRSLAPGEQASLVLEFPIELRLFEETIADDLAAPDAVQPGSLLVYEDASLAQGYVWLDCVDGCAGGASRPRLRLSR